MAVLKHKTRGMITPQGKQRVYFCCHPDDFELYFKTISDDILKKQNCAIWYVKDYNTTYDEKFFNDLKGMQLFVIPVTTNFLFSESHAFSVEFEFAIENHIPVLPLMQERGLEKIFNKKCGDLQFLDKTVTDITAISYDEKLEKYLNSILVGDEIAEKIRAAFDAYVFLSYRKKDRKYAQELMRLIHKNDFCRDIAIWYDEFLTPGEDFNNSIEEALDKSELFVLAVTPNLVNEINYVMTKEYPKAKELGKVILPAELVATDKKELSEKYEDIPIPVDAHNDNVFTKALLEAVKKIAIKENDGSPEHNFFIGLAYLSGVDVEVDHERALSLITSSAEAGLLEAMTKLVEMYRTGIGVERSYKIAIEWQARIVKQCKLNYERTPDKTNFIKFVESIILCGDYWEELGKTTNAENMYYYADEVIKTYSQQFESECTSIYTYKILMALGNIHLREYNHDEAKKKYMEAANVHKTIFKDGVKDVDMDIYRMSKWISCMLNLGDVYKAEGKNEEASKIYSECLNASIAYRDAYDTLGARRCLAISFGRSGDICKTNKEFGDAIKYYEKAIEMCSFIVSVMNTDEHKTDLAICYSNMADIYMLDKNPESALKFYNKAFEIFSRIYEESTTYDARKNLSVIYGKLGGFYSKNCKPEEAIGFFKRDIEICKHLVEETDELDSKMDLSMAYSFFGDFYKENDNIEKAIYYYEESLEIRQAIVEKTNLFETKKKLEENYKKLFRAYKSIGDNEKIKYFYEKWLGIKVQIAKEDETLNTRKDLYEGYEKLGDVYKSEGDIKKAIECYENALDIRALVVEKTNAIEERQELSSRCIKLGAICEAEDNLEKAKGFYKKALEIRKAIVKENDTEETRKDLSVCYNKLSSVFETEGNRKLAKEYSDKAIDINLYGVDEQVSDDKKNSEKNDENLIKKLKKRFLKK